MVKLTYESSTPRNEVMPYEEYVIGRRYAFTINPELQCVEVSDSTDRYKAVRQQILKILNHDSFDYELYLELSPTGRVHGHGYIVFHNPFVFVMTHLHQICMRATVCIKYIDDEAKWQQYILKQVASYPDVIMPLTIVRRPSNKLINQIVPDKVIKECFAEATIPVTDYYPECYPK